MNYTNLKSVSRHVANLRRQGLGFPFSLSTLVSVILEVTKYQQRKLVTEWLCSARSSVLDDNETAVVYAFTTRFKLLAAFREESEGAIDPVTSREEIQETQRYGTVWGIDWYVNRDMPENEIWVSYAVDQLNDALRLNVLKFRIKDNDDLERVA